MVLKVHACVPHVIDIKYLLGYLLKCIKYLLRYTPYDKYKVPVGVPSKMVIKFLEEYNTPYDTYKVPVGIPSNGHQVPGGVVVDRLWG